VAHAIERFEIASSLSLLAMTPKILLGLALLIAVPANAQRAVDPAYPSRVIRLITPFSAGSTLDVMARLVAERLTGALAHNVVVDNRPGWYGL
jgi:tripartite-type tricarboxylate transporter receptor subunit TctC